MQRQGDGLASPAHAPSPGLCLVPPSAGARGLHPIQPGPPPTDLVQPNPPRPHHRACSVTQAGQFVSLEGSLTHPGTGALDWVRAHPQEAAVPGPDTPGVNGGTPPKKKEPGSEKGKKEKKRKRHPDVPTPVTHSTDKKKKKTKPAQ